jgi:hypothetical protein
MIDLYYILLIVMLSLIGVPVISYLAGKFAAYGVMKGMERFRERKEERCE